MALARGDTRKGYVGFASGGDNFTIFNEISDGDFVIKGNDGGSTITAMTIDMSAGGNVGIGTASPGFHVDIQKSLSETYSASARPTALTRVMNTNTANGNHATLEFGTEPTSGNGGVGFIGSTVTGSNLADLFFGTRTGASSFATHMTIDSAGEVGIGTTSPANILDVSTTLGRNRFSDNGHVLCQNKNNDSTNYWTFAPRDGGHMSIGYGTPDSAGTVSTNYLAISTAGLVGIGTTSPESQLHLSTSDSQDDADGQLKIVQTAAGSGAATNASLCTMNASGTSQFMQWQNNGLRIGSRIATGSGVGHVVFTAGQDVEAMRITEQYRVGIGTSTPATLLDVDGAVTKNSGSFRIDHPIPAMEDTHSLVHSFIEGPRADLIYRGVVDLVDGSATVNIDTAAGMTDGTFVLLCDDVQCFTTNEDNWDLVKASVSGNILTIESQNVSSTATISWMVIGDRKDQHMFDTSWTDENGKVIVEPERITGE